MATKTFGIDSTQDWPVQVVDNCKRVVVQENYNSVNAPSSDLLQKQPISAAAVNIPKGTPAIYTPLGREWFFAGEIIGTIRVAPTQAGVTVQQIESSQV